MKVIARIFSILVLLLMVVSCAITARAIPEKYNFNNELEAIEEITTLETRRWPRWEEIDNQSMILRANRDDYYLLVLRRPINPMYSNSQIRISRTTPTITSGIERVFVSPSGDTEGYVIEKIYSLDGKEQAKEIKERLSES